MREKRRVSGGKLTGNRMEKAKAKGERNTMNIIGHCHKRKRRERKLGRAVLRMHHIVAHNGYCKREHSDGRQDSRSSVPGEPRAPVVITIVVQLATLLV